MESFERTEDEEAHHLRCCRGGRLGPAPNPPPPPPAYDLTPAGGSPGAETRWVGISASHSADAQLINVLEGRGEQLSGVSLKVLKFSHTKEVDVHKTQAESPVSTVRQF